MPVRTGLSSSRAQSSDVQVCVCVCVCVCVSGVCVCEWCVVCVCVCGCVSGVQCGCVSGVQCGCVSGVQWGVAKKEASLFPSPPSEVLGSVFMALEGVGVKSYERVVTPDRESWTAASTMAVSVKTLAVDVLNSQLYYISSEDGVSGVLPYTGHLGSSGAILSHLGSSGIILSHLGSSEIILSHLGSSEIILSHWDHLRSS